LGNLASEVARGADPVLITKRGRPLAVLVGEEEYAKLRDSARAAARAELRARLAEVRAAGVPGEFSSGG